MVLIQSLQMTDLCHQCTQVIPLLQMGAYQLGPAMYCKLCWEALPVDRCRACEEPLEEGSTHVMGDGDFCAACYAYRTSGEACVL